MLKRITLFASLAVIFAAVTASPAFATGTAWSNTGALYMKGTLTLKRDGASAVNCTISGQGFTAQNVEGWAHYSTPLFPVPSVKCANGETWQYGAEGEIGSSLLFRFGDETFGKLSPWKETYATVNGYVPFVNGSGSTMSHIDFNETQIGLTSGGKKMTATGSLELYRSGGLLVTVKAI